MAQRLTTSFVNTNIPGAYVETTVKSTPVGITSTGDILIIGEASGGADISNEILKNNFFTATQLDRVRAKYISGPIVDAMAALTSPSNDTEITGSAGRVYIVKTNEGDQASGDLLDASAAIYATLTDKNYGLDGNKYSYQVTQVDSEVAPSITGSAIAYAALSATLINQDVTYTAVTAGVAGNSITITLVDPAANNQAESVSVLGNAITVNLATDGGGLITSTATSIVASITGSVPASALVTASGAGASPVTALGATNLAGGDNADGSIFDGLSFSLRSDGGTVSVVTLGVGEATHDTVAELAAEIDSLLPASMECFDSGQQLVIRRVAAVSDAEANALGYGKSFELIDSTPGDLLAIGLAAGLSVSSQEPEIQLSITRQDTNVNESHIANAEVAFSIGYVGTSATVTISGGVLTTSVAGGTGANLNINLNQYTTMSNLADYIGSQTGYSASSVSSSNSLSPLRLDEVAAVGIASSAAVKPGRIKKAAYNMALKVSSSSTLNLGFSQSTGLPADMANKAFLTGGTKGATTGANIVTGLSAAEGVKVNFVIPLFSRNAADDIAEEITDSASTYTIDAINFATKSHCLAMSTVKLKKNRIAMLSKFDTYLNVKEHAQTLASFRSLVFSQRTSQANSLNEVVNYLPWHTAAIAAGMQSAGFYKSLTAKFANIISFTDPSGFDSGNFDDTEDATDAGLMLLQSETAGSKWIVDQTTYGFDQNFVYNSLQAMYMSDVLSVQLADFLTRFIVGKSLADINAAAIAGQIAKKMEEFRKTKIIGASDDAPLGYKGLDIEINGPIVSIKVEAKLATAILFIPVQLELSQIQSSASA